MVDQAAREHGGDVALHGAAHEPPTRLSHPAFRWAATTPAAPALSEGETTWRYRDLAVAVLAAADLLRELGVRAGDRVMLIGENGLALAAFILAAAHVDACAVLENARRAPREVDAIRAHCAPRRVIYLGGHSPDAAAHAQRHGAARHTLPLIGEIAVGALADASEPDAQSGGADDVAVLIYTTGTTGTPKGVMLTHANLLYLSAMMLDLRRMRSSDRVYGVLPITHVMGLAAAFNATLRAGAHVRLVPRFTPHACFAALANEGITMLQGAPAMFAKLVAHARQHAFSAPALRFIAAGGAPIDPTLKADVERLFRLTLHNGYGLTEGSGLSWTRLDAPRADCSVGLPLPGVEVRLLGADGAEVRAGDTGELWARGPNVMRGYYRNPELTARVTRAGGWFNTEDLAHADADGHLHIDGRTRELILSSGFNVYPIEVENALNAHPAVVHSAVLAKPGDASEVVVAFVELAAGQSLSLAQMQAFLADRLSPYKRPREIYAMAALPASPNGKVLKQGLRDALRDGVPAGATRLA